MAYSCVEPGSVVFVVSSLCFVQDLAYLRPENPDAPLEMLDVVQCQDE